MLEIKNLSFAVSDEGSGKEIIKDISLEIPDGKLYVITGPNGGGKSTLAKLIAGIETPTSGQIIFNGEDITGMNVTERANKGIGFAFQQPVKFKGIRVLDLIRLASGKKISVTEACRYLSMVGLCAREYINREVNSSLSGGELKRMIDVFRRQREEIADSSILIISHQERILNIADEIIVLDSGSIVDRGDKDDVLPRLIGTPSAVDKCRGVYQA